MFTHIHTHTHTNTHISQINSRQCLHYIRKKLYSLSLQNSYTCILIILLHYHLAGDLVLINCQNVINYVKIVMYIQFGMLT